MKKQSAFSAQLKSKTLFIETLLVITFSILLSIIIVTFSVRFLNQAKTVDTRLLWQAQHPYSTTKTPSYASLDSVSAARLKEAMKGVVLEEPVVLAGNVDSVNDTLLAEWHLTKPEIKSPSREAIVPIDENRINLPQSNTLLP
jgi:hypothetical protein